MNPFSRRVVVALALGVLLLPAALPSVTADHAYSHRYVVLGRLIDTNGDPIPGAVVNVGVEESVGVEGYCGQQPNSGTDAWQETTTVRQTNQYGEFMYCFHTHGISRGVDAEVRAEYNGTEVTAAIDPFYRKNFLVLQTDTEEGETTDAFSSSYLVSGRVWYDRDTRLEQVSVYGKTYNFENVTITFETAAGETVTEESTTNGYGDFAVRMPVDAAEDGRITIAVAGESYSYDADPEVRATDVNIEIPDPENPLMTVLKVGGGILLVAAVLGGGTVAWKKASEKREIARARETSTRKRAQR